MIYRSLFVTLLSKYGLDGEKLIRNHSRILELGEYTQIEEIARYLQKIKISPRKIEKCPSIFYLASCDVIQTNYEFFIRDTIFLHEDIENCLSILVEDPQKNKNIYSFVLNKYGEDVLKKTPTILTGDYQDIVSITTTLEETIGLDIVKDGGATFLTKTTGDEIRKILMIPCFQYDADTGEYNHELLNATTFNQSYLDVYQIVSMDIWNRREFRFLLSSEVWRRTFEEIKDILFMEEWKDEHNRLLLSKNIWRRTKDEIREILALDVWKNDKFSSLLTPMIWFKKKKQIEDILNLDVWNREEFHSLLTPAIWVTNSERVQGILGLDVWKDPEKSLLFKPLLTPTIWIKSADQVRDILELDVWKEEKFQHLLTPNIWHKNAKQIKDILMLDVWKEEKFQYLLAPTVWAADAKKIKAILKLDIWEQPKFRKILTVSIWATSVKNVEQIAGLPLWEDDWFDPLLISAIWNKKADQIMKNIQILIENGLKQFSNNSTLVLRFTSCELQAKINYLKVHGQSLYDDKGNIHGIFGMSNQNMQKKYGISNKELVRDYFYIGEENKNVL